jgi:hypothetical protein
VVRTWLAVAVLRERVWPAVVEAVHLLRVIPELRLPPELVHIDIGAKGEIGEIALRANRRSFDCASRDETARGSAQDDNFYITQSLKLKLYVDTAQCRGFPESFINLGEYLSFSRDDQHVVE